MLHLAPQERAGSWGMLGINLRPPALAPMLGAQDGLYGRMLRDGQTVDARVLGGIVRVMDGADGVVAALADPAIAVVSLTITEKGYCHVPATGLLDVTHPDVVADVAALQADPLAEHASLRSTPAILVAMLARRRAEGTTPPTLMSCDNVPDNGALLAGVVRGVAELTDPALAEWIAAHVSVPNTMVDRIVPATRAEDLSEFAALAGVRDEATVVGEPFLQWVIEDRFGGPRPPWELVGVRMVSDVRPFEEMKFRVVNGAQSLLCYLGHLDGIDLMWQVMQVPEFVAVAERLLDTEVAPTLRVPAHVDTVAYRAMLLRRLRNTAVAHRTQQIATDGSRKIPQRFLAPIGERLARGLDSPVLYLGVAAWMRYVGGVGESGTRHTVEDPLVDRLLAIRAAAGDRVDDLVAGYIAERDVFGDELAADPRFVAGVRNALRLLVAHGAREAVRRVLPASAR